MNVNKLYALNHDEVVSLAMAIGKEVTILVEGDMGSGKTSLLTTLLQMLPTHIGVYFDCTTKTVGDLSLPNFQMIGDSGVVTYAFNEELGLHLDRPIVLLIDEYGKADPDVKTGLLRAMLERQMGTKKFHPDSIVICTTNLGAENVGDLIPPHARNRLCKVTMRKPDGEEWIEWGINNNVNPILLGAAREFPQFFQSFTDYPNQQQGMEDNPYIYFPASTQEAFVTHRSLAKASKVLDTRDVTGDKVTTAGLIGMLGQRAAMDIAAFVALDDDLPKRDEIKNSPETAKVPTSASAMCMVIYRAAATIEREWMDAWVTYLNRCSAEAQGLFANLVRNQKYIHRDVVMTNKKYQAWALANKHMFAGDKA